MKRENIRAEDNAGHSQLEQQKKTNDLKQHGKEKTHRQKIMLDKVQPEQQNKTNDLKQHGKEKT